MRKGFVGESEGKRSIGTLWRALKDNIKVCF